MFCGVLATLGDNFGLWPFSAFSGATSQLIAGWVSCTGRMAGCSPVPPLLVALKTHSHLVPVTQPELSQGARCGAEASCCWVRVTPISAACTAAQCSPGSPNSRGCLSQPTCCARACSSQPFGSYGCCSSGSFLSFTKGMQPAQADNLDAAVYPNSCFSSKIA